MEKISQLLSAGHLEIAWALALSKTDESEKNLALEHILKHLLDDGTQNLPRGVLDDIQKTVNFLNRKLTDSELLSLFDNNFTCHFETTLEAVKLMSDEIRLGKLNVILQECLSSGHTERVETIAELLPLGEKTAALESNLSIYLSKGKWDLAQKAAISLDRRLNKFELQIALKACLDSGNFGDSIEIAGILGRELNNSELDLLLEFYQERLILSRVKDLIKSLIPSKSKTILLEKLVRIFLQEDSPVMAEAIVDLITGPDQIPVLTETLNYSLKHNDLEDAKRIAHRLGRGLTGFELRGFVRVSLNHQTYDRALEGAMLSSEPERDSILQTVFDRCLEKKLVVAQKTAEQMSPELKKLAFQAILNKQIELGQLDKAKETAQILLGFN